MHQMPVEFAPSEGRTGELELIRGEVLPLRTAIGFVLGGAISLVAWGAVGVACYLFI